VPSGLYPLLRQQNADVVAFDVVGDEVGFAVVVHVNNFDAPAASADAEGRAGHAFKTAATVAEKYRDAKFRAKGEIDFAVAI
jgi:hypothetical protein